MPHQQKSPEGQVADAIKNSWVDQFAPISTRPYLRLSRLDRPIGTWLLYIPCVWGILLAALHDSNLRLWDLWLILACGLGALLMRGAGCTWNDITDRNYDALVSRTKSRPIPSGQISVKNALFWMLIQAFCALGLLITFGPTAIIFGIASICLVVIYPFAKRFTWWPQILLGLAFNWGVLLGWVAHTGSLDWPAVVLYCSGIFWTLFYDTIYAHQDTDDDALIGLKSTARLFGNKTHYWLILFLLFSFSAMIWALLIAIPLKDNVLIVALLGPITFGLHMIWQIVRLNTENKSNLLKLFRSNREAGLFPVLFFVIANML